DEHSNLATSGRLLHDEITEVAHATPQIGREAHDLKLVFGRAQEIAPLLCVAIVHRVQHEFDLLVRVGLLPRDIETTEWAGRAPTRSFETFNVLDDLFGIHSLREGARAKAVIDAAQVV